MILKKLCDYYDECVASGLPLPQRNRAYVKVFYAIVIDSQGNFRRFEPLGDKNGLEILAVGPAVRSTAPKPNAFYDNGIYLLGIDPKALPDNEALIDSLEVPKCKKNHAAFREMIRQAKDALPQNRTILAIDAFYQMPMQERLREWMADSTWKDFAKALIRNLTFRIEGETALACEDPELLAWVDSLAEEGDATAVCLVTGQKTAPVALADPTPIIGGKTNGKLVAFQTSSGYDSYGKSQCLNAPVSYDATFRYTAALRWLLRRDGRSQFRVGSRTFLFWSTLNETGRLAADCCYDMLNMAAADTDSDDAASADPNAKAEQARKVFAAIYSGTIATTLEDRFAILGLAPNAGRIAVVHWTETPLRVFAGTILKHLQDMEIVDGRKEKRPYAGLRQMVAAVTKDSRKTDDAPPNLAEAVAKSIFQGLPYPFTLFAATIRRIHSDETPLTVTRVAILKAYLNRQIPQTHPRKITPMLDNENTNPGYLCGRLFAVLEKIQRDANNLSTIRERFLSAASAMPATVFPTILKLSSHHAENLAEGKRIFFEKKKQEIVDKLPAQGFPAHLSLQDQGRFFIGYYHQTQDFFAQRDNQTQTQE